MSETIIQAIVAQLNGQKKPTEKQQRIIEQAIKLFAEKGYANTSTKEIAVAAGVAEATIFRHYGTKDKLLLSVIIPFLKDSAPILADDFIKEIMPDHFPTFEAFIRGFMMNRLLFFEQNKEIFQVVVKELIYNEDLRNDIFPHFAKHMLVHLHHVLDIFKQRGDIKNLPNETLIKMIFPSIFSFYITSFILFPNAYKEDKTEEVEHVIAFIIRGIQN